VRLAGKLLWSELLPLVDDTWCTDCDPDTVMERVLRRRQMADGRDPEVAARRGGANHCPHAVLIAPTKAAARVVVPSLPFKHASQFKTGTSVSVSPMCG